MNQNIKGAFRKAKAAMKNAVGRMAGYKKTQTEAKWDRAKGEMNRKAGDIKEGEKQATKR